MLKKVFRFIFTFCGMLLGYGLTNYILNESKFGDMIVLEPSSNVLLIALFTGFFGLIFLYIFTKYSDNAEQFVKRLEKLITGVSVAELISETVGLILGLLAAFLISQIINGIEVLKTAYINVVIILLLYVGLGALGSFIFRVVARRITKNYPRGSFGRGEDAFAPAEGSPKIIDTSVIIDGRIADVLKTGFLEGQIIIPEFVLVELRHIADSADGLKRNRGRRGLDILGKIQNDYRIEIYNTENDKVLQEIPEVDVKLIKLAQKMGGVVVTTDFNLNKVASIQGVGVLNINDLANALKPAVLPGEVMKIYLVKEGKEHSQAVAYLDDGTMVVVEDGKGHIGETVQTVVTSVLQTSAGRMIFARVADEILKQR